MKQARRWLLLAAALVLVPQAAYAQKKKPKGGELSMSDKEYNSQKASFRAPVERLVAHFKNWKIFHTDYRRPYGTYDDAFDAARGLFFFSITRGF